MRLSITLAAFQIAFGLSFYPVYAQNVQNWENNQNNQIQQDQSSGLINPNQAGFLQNRETQIQQQQQQYMNQNGGTLTPQQQSQINSELHGVNRGMNNDVRRNSQMNGQAPPNMMNGNGYVPPGGWQNQQYPNGNPQQWQNANNQGQNQNNNGQWPNGGHHHHHNWQQQQQNYQQGNYPQGNYQQGNYPPPNQGQGGWGGR